MQVRIQALPVESYKVMSDGKEITMISTVFGGTCLYADNLEVKSLSELESTVFGIFKGLQEKGQQFSLRVRPMSRKLRGYDARNWNRDFTN